MVMATKKAVVEITLKLEFDLNEEHSYQLVTRLEGDIHNHIAMGMLAAYHPEDACLTNVDMNSVVEEL